MTTPGLRPASYEQGGSTEGAGSRARFLLTPVREPSDPLALVPRPRRTASPPRVLWRLLSGNNRQLARSPGAFPSAAEAYAAALALALAADDLDVAAVCLTRPVRWVWTARLAGVVVAVSGRAYERERLAAGALETFVEGLRDVSVDDPTAGPAPLSS